ESINYIFEDDGTLTVYAPSTDLQWWTFIGDNDAVELKGWEVDEDVYYGNVASKLEDGTVHIIMGHYNDGDDAPDDYAVIDAVVEGGKIVEVDNSGFINDLSQVFDVE
ncbi:MAG: hypothetical protein K5931_02825, partial [Lachnospiraceae bacterium]|nr:hypothetical protein [Lachnospiraceae bacterium]